MKTSSFLAAYIECALWSSCDESGEPLDAEFCRDDLHTSTLVTMRADCADFLFSNRHWLTMAREAHGYTLQQAGHDFWLTRNGHGAGFWDRGLGLLGEEMTANAKAYGDCDLYEHEQSLFIA